VLVVWFLIGDEASERRWQLTNGEQLRLSMSRWQRTQWAWQGLHQVLAGWWSPPQVRVRVPDLHCLCSDRRQWPLREHQRSWSCFSFLRLFTSVPLAPLGSTPGEGLRSDGSFMEDQSLLEPFFPPAICILAGEGRCTCAGMVLCRQAGLSKTGRYEPVRARGKSELQRAECWLTASGGDPKESACATSAPVGSCPQGRKVESKRPLGHWLTWRRKPEGTEACHESG
jgi:hypothetical protein